MFRQHPKEINQLVRGFLRANGLETPWLQHRLVTMWPEVAGSVVAQYTEEIFIKNQILMVRITSPAVRADLQMRRTELVRQLNSKVQSQIITDIRLF